MQPSGSCERGFEAVADAFVSNFERGLEVGASVAVAVGGELVADVWGGTVDDDDGTAWSEDTIINVFSTTKTMTCLALLVCADRGLVDVDVPVSSYWPEFSANGKDGVLVRHLLSHTAGLPGWASPIQPADLYDWRKVTDLLAAQAPWWEPGTKSGYHALTQGYLVGEVVRRVTGRSVGTFFADEIAGPLGADFHIGLGPEHDSRVVPVVPVPPVGPGTEGGKADKTSVAYRTFVNPSFTAEQSNEPEWRRAEIPAAGGFGNARSIALVQSVVSNRGVAKGLRLLSEPTIDRIFDVQAAGRDLVLGIGVTFGVGYGLNSPRAPISPNRRVCYWGGWGGSLVVNDVDAGFTMAYAMNKMGEGTVGDDRAHTILRAVYDSL